MGKHGDSCVKRRHSWRQHVARFGLLTMIVSMSACATGPLGIGSDSWKEEAQQYNGSTIIVERSQDYGGRGEVGQGAPIRDYRLSFTLPGSARAIEWESDYSEDVGRANLHPLAVHVLNGTPYVITEPNLCLAYNKWGRPNPPYVIFKYDGRQWQRITIEGLPAEFKGMNLVIDTKNEEEEFKQLSGKTGFVAAADVRNFNSSLTQPEYKTVLRGPIQKGKIVSSVNCEEMIHYKCGWFGTAPDGKLNQEFADRMCNK